MPLQRVYAIGVQHQRPVQTQQLPHQFVRLPAAAQTQPISTASHEAARRRMSSSAERDSFPSDSGIGKGMASSLLMAVTCQMLSGTARYTSPAPQRTAARWQNTGAPAKTHAGRNTRTAPFRRYPCAHPGRGCGSMPRPTSPAVIDSISRPSSLYCMYVVQYTTLPHPSRQVNIFAANSAFFLPDALLSRFHSTTLPALGASAREKTTFLHRQFCVYLPKIPLCKVGKECVINRHNLFKEKRRTGKSESARIPQERAGHPVCKPARGLPVFARGACCEEMRSRVSPPLAGNPSCAGVFLSPRDFGWYHGQLPCAFRPPVRRG